MRTAVYFMAPGTGRLIYEPQIASYEAFGDNQNQFRVPD